MSQYVVEVASTETASISAAHRGDGQATGPVAWFATMVGLVLSPPRREERGMVTVEFIFGVLIAIAIVTVVVTALGQKELSTFFLGVLKKLVNMIFAGN